MVDVHDLFLCVDGWVTAAVCVVACVCVSMCAYVIDGGRVHTGVMAGAWQCPFARLS